MKSQLAFLMICILAAHRMSGQVSTIFPPQARDSLIAREARSPTARRDRQRNLDSLAAGRRRWADAHVAEYEFQLHADCSCILLDSVPRLLLEIVRDDKIVGHARGRPATGYFREGTIDSLFAWIERDLRDPGRVVRRLDLDPRYGFPRAYSAETPPIPDAWLSIQVDSFAVTRQVPTLPDKAKSPNE